MQKIHKMQKASPKVGWFFLCRNILKGIPDK